jgi:hypothetical protein
MASVWAWLRSFGDEWQKLVTGGIVLAALNVGSAFAGLPHWTYALWSVLAVVGASYLSWSSVNRKLVAAQGQIATLRSTPPTLRATVYALAKAYRDFAASVPKDDSTLPGRFWQQYPFEQYDRYMNRMSVLLGLGTMKWNIEIPATAAKIEEYANNLESHAARIPPDQLA